MLPPLAEACVTHCSHKFISFSLGLMATTRRAQQFMAILDVPDTF
jgi:hypothetical protein